ncbi:MAG: AarF/ABC1/UbiB kinase family protein [Rhodobacteraceae bacterium]|nr:AarF/ABC1/UbiB kinase family protein [Paracoccaceae bacterium]
MSKKPHHNKSVAIPSGRITRLSHIGSMTANVAGNMMLGGIMQLGRGQRPVLKDLLLTPRNIERVTEKLSKMRGAAMKIGQLVSMDTGDILPPELAQIMSRLRDDAYAMPPKQLKQVLNAQLPDGWVRLFRKFDVHPIAAASIGQVHRVHLKDGRDLALKIQYPGVANSIDSDVANVGVLIKMSGLLPDGFEMAPYLEAARQQLHDETDYVQEAGQLIRFGQLLKDKPQFAVPTVHTGWSTSKVLAMDYMAGGAIEDVAIEPQSIRNQVMTDLINLALCELFDFGVMQTDPNFANYLYDPETRKIVLLDFGAVLSIDPMIADKYRRLICAGLQDDTDGLMTAAQDMGLIDATTRDEHRVRIVQIIRQVFDMIRDGGAIDFTDQTLSKQLQAEGIALYKDGFLPPILPIDILLIQRKFAGLFLLGARLGANMDVADILRSHSKIIR